MTDAELVLLAMYRLTGGRTDVTVSKAALLAEANRISVITQAELDAYRAELRVIADTRRS